MILRKHTVNTKEQRGEDRRNNKGHVPRSNDGTRVRCHVPMTWHTQAYGRNHDETSRRSKEKGKNTHMCKYTCSKAILTSFPSFNILGGL